MDFDAVIFDMDGVLCDTIDYHYRSWKDAIAHLRIPFTPEDNEKLLGLTRSQSLAVILGEEKLPETQKQEIMRRKNEIFLDLIHHMGPDERMSGVGDLINEVKAAGLLVGVASASRNAPIVLERIGLAEFIDAIGDGNTVERSKPAPDVYLHAASALGVEPARCIAIEDGAAGIEAALAAGMCVIGLGPANRVGRADAVYPDLSQIHLRDLSLVYHYWRTRPKSSNGQGYPSDLKPSQLKSLDK